MGRAVNVVLKIASGLMRYKSNIPDYIWIAFGLPIPLKEYLFHEKRKWRVDYVILYRNNGIIKNIAIEIEGGAWINGRHTRGSGFINDMEKYNALSEYGYTLFRYQPGKVDFAQIKRFLESDI